MTGIGSCLLIVLKGNMQRVAYELLNMFKQLFNLTFQLSLGKHVFTSIAESTCFYNIHSNLAQLLLWGIQEIDI